MKRIKTLPSLVAAAVVLGTASVLVAAARPAPPLSAGERAELSFASIYWEYNDSGNDLGVHVSLDGEDWVMLKIFSSRRRLLFEVRGKGPYRQMGMTELFFEGAEPSLGEFPLEELLARFPEGEYEFEGRTVDGEFLVGSALFTHAIAQGPEVFSFVGANDFLEISWNPVTQPPAGFPNLPIQIEAYQVIVEDFEVTVPASVTSVTVPPEYMGTFDPGEHEFEVLAIESSGNQSITEGTFVW